MDVMRSVLGMVVLLAIAFLLSVTLMSATIAGFFIGLA